MVTKDTLEDLIDVLRRPLTPTLKKQINQGLQKDGFAYLKMLQTAFHQLDKKREELNGEADSLNDDRLKKIAMIYKCLVLVSDLVSIEGLLGDQFYESTFGALEMLPAIRDKLQIREFFKTEVIFKQVLPIKNPGVLRKIHLVYRANYLKETVFAKDEGPSMPQSLVFCCMNYTADVLSALLNNHQYL